MLDDSILLPNNCTKLGKCVLVDAKKREREGGREETKTLEEENRSQGGEREKR